MDFFVDGKGEFVPNPEGWLERRCLGGLLELPEAYDLLDWRNEFFGNVLHGKIFDSIESLREKGLPADVVLVANDLMPNKELVARVYECFEDKAFTIVDLKFWHGVLKRNWALRVVEMQAKNILENPESYVEALEVIRLADEVSASDVELAAVTDFLADYRVRRVEGEAVVSCGEPALDVLLDGGWRSGFYGIAARMKQGKSMVLLYLARRLAEQGKRVLFVSYEMTREQLMDRLISQVFGIDSTLVARNELDFEVEFRGNIWWAKDLVDSASDFLPAGLVIECPKDRTVHGLRVLVARLGGVDAVFVDYAQIMDDGGRHSTESEKCKAISRKLHALSIEKDMPIVSALQLRRPDGVSDKKIPDSKDIAESDQFARDASAIFFIVRSRVEGEPEWAVGSELLMHLGINRFGSSGTVARFIAEDKFSRITHKAWR